MFSIILSLINENMEEMKMVYSVYELSGVNRCKMRRNRDIHLQKSIDDQVIKRSVLAKKCIEDVLTRKITGQQAADMIDDFFKNITDDFIAEKTKKIFADDMKRCINRYLVSETRVPNFFPEANINLYPDMDVTVKPDMVFFTNDKIEIVKLRYSKPRITASGRKQDLSAHNSLEMYSMLCYGRKFVQPGKKAYVSASIYYLRKANDSESKGIFDSDFFDTTGRNVVTLSELYVNDGQKNDMDKEFIPQIQEFLKGSDAKCDEKKCATCEFYRICSYKKSPIKIVKEKKVKSISSLNLTKEQSDAINFEKGIARINAGAGAGKTLTVALRTVTLLNKGVKPSEIVLLTFTNTGAEEMRERINAYNQEFGSGCDITDMHIQTFNAFEDEIVHKEWECLGFDKEPKLIDDVERSSIIAGILKNKDIKGLDYRNFFMNTKDVQGALIVARKIFAIMKTYTLGDDPDDIQQIAKHLGLLGKFLPLKTIEDVALLYDEYQDKLNEDSLIEFADQEKLVFQLLCKKPDYFERMGIKHVIVDEFQDSNEGQMDFIKTIIDTPNFESLMVVGDDSQAIFGFRDTSPKYIIDFYDILKRKGQDFYLLENHRSTPEIIDFANKLNDLNTCKVAKSLIATRPHGMKPVARGFFNREQEYEYIKDSIEKKIKSGIKPEDIAFIASTKNELLKMASILTEAGIPSVLLNPEPLMENSKVLAAIDMIKFINNPTLTECEMNWLNCLNRNMLLTKSDKEIQAYLVQAKAQIEILRSYPEKQKMETICQMLTALDEDDEVYENFVDTLKGKSTVKKLIQYCMDFELYGAECAYKRQSDYPGVVLTTAHSSKGLEWPIVYNSITKYDSPEIRKKKPLLEEKRRLLFVSSTRARDELYITGEYVAYGAKDDRTYNKFLIEAYQILGQDFQPNATV